MAIRAVLLVPPSKTARRQAQKVWETSEGSDEIDSATLVTAGVWDRLICLGHSRMA